MKGKLKNQHAILLLAVIIVVHVVLLVVFGSHKGGYGYDELWSYGLSNSYYNSIPSGCDNEKHVC